MQLWWDLRFKTSAAVSAASDVVKQGISDAKQIVSENFDSDISSPNGKSSTHSLAMIIMQPAGGDEPLVGYTIMRLRKRELNTPILNDHELLGYNGPKKPEQLCISWISGATSYITKTIWWKNLAFLHDVLMHEQCP